jgi:NADH-quinone oxidoreductase subunit L
VAGAFITAFYMTRAIALTFFGTYKGHGHPHESPTIMTGPLWVLAIPSLFAGFLNVPGLKLGSLNNFTTWVAAREVPMNDYHPEAPNWTLAAIGLSAAALGIALGWMLFSRDADSQEARDRLEIPVLYPLLRAKYYMDHVAWGIVGFTMGPAARAMNWVNTYIIDGIINGIAAAVMALGRFVYGGLDQRGIDGFYNGMAMASDAAGTGMRRLQTGRVQQYATGFMVGALVLVVTVAIFR